jgi:hypothetical protein
MKKGCFLKIIIILTILVAAILYVVGNKFDDLILKPGVKVIKSVVNNNLDKELIGVKNTPEKDSLRIIINDFLDNGVQNIHKASDKMVEEIVDSIKYAVTDSVINESELSNIKKMLKKFEEQK